ncbi:hypothetical protein CL176_01830 [Suicoccus acidiformans]|uniref:Uncharacterized protein n=1 Tax=Suicoccus acidiformans TaxID=2036206 RepID=A0A347WIF2_9LACT|nr:hypothetical protein CL176_01830 [Suicoccus acidiformans]
MTDLSVYEKIQTLSLLDDRFMSVVFEKKEFAASFVCCNLKRDHLRGKLLFKKGPLAMPFHL